jgi:hypothetical protein
MSRITGVLMVAVIVLAVVYAYNRFSGSSIADLGKAAA